MKFGGGIAIATVCPSVRPSVCYQDSGHSFESIIAIFGQNMLLYSRRNPIKFESSFLKGIEIVMKIVS